MTNVSNRGVLLRFEDIQMRGRQYKAHLGLARQDVFGNSFPPARKPMKAFSRWRMFVGRDGPEQVTFLARGGEGVSNSADDCWVEQLLQVEVAIHFAAHTVGHAVDDLRAVLRGIDVHAERTLAEGHVHDSDNL